MISAYSDELTDPIINNKNKMLSLFLFPLSFLVCGHIELLLCDMQLESHMGHL
jgi:hypothetical protein